MNQNFKFPRARPRRLSDEQIARIFAEERARVRAERSGAP